MSGLLIFIYILLILLAIVLIVSVLMQEGNRAGLGAIGGGAETFFGKSKSKGVQGKLQLITKAGATAFIVLAIIATALTAMQNPTTTPEETPIIEAIEGEGAEVEATGEETTADEAGTGDEAAEPTTDEPAVEPEVEPATEPETETEPEATPAA